MMSLPMDESPENSYIAQLCLFVRFFDNKCFWEELLELLHLEGHVTGEVIFNSIVSFFEENKLESGHINLLITDDALAMAGRIQGLSAHLATVVPQLRSLQCLLHQSLFCAKLSGQLKESMDSTKAIINFICCTSSLQHRLFRQLLSDMSAQYNELLIHNGIRWLGKGKALKRFCELDDEMAFLQNSKHKQAQKCLTLMENREFAPGRVFFFK